MYMDEADKRILENEISIPLGKAISKWAKKNGVEGPVVIHASVTQPSCYIDEQGVSHLGNLITVNCEIVDTDVISDDEED